MTHSRRPVDGCLYGLEGDANRLDQVLYFAVRETSPWVHRCPGQGRCPSSGYRRTECYDLRSQGPRRATGETPAQETAADPSDELAEIAA
jgi:hypothetical protein